MKPAAVTPTRMILRGLSRRCPFCGHNQIFEGWFKLKERCPECSHRFNQEEGFYIGAYALNFAITEGLLLLFLIPYIVISASDPDFRLNVVPFALAAVVAAIVGPILFFPFSRSLWVAIDLTLRGGRNLEKGEDPAEAG
ncbi:MAG TPA: DUF983 domain-containing protein [Actinomycetota bacterium]|nr:DUF983 domain-containing protein [Actinomycetota bacterium]